MAIAAATALATHLMRACSTSTGQGTLWPVDAALRPEGKNGPLVRTIESHRAYYERWAKTWEFQALLKARPVAGDRALGQAYLDAVRPMVWQAASRENFVEDVQAMRRRVEQHVPPAEADRQLKLGPGGLRDVEFSVQLLQLVHGRSDDTLRSGTTLEALGALAARWLRRAARTRPPSTRRTGCCGRWSTAIQLFRLRRTHLMPTAEADLRRLGRALGHRSDAGGRGGRPVAAAGARGAPHPRAPLLPPPARRGRPAQLDRRAAGPGGGAGPPGGAGLPRPGGRHPPPRGADLRGEPPRRDPAHPAAGDARLVRRRGRPRRWAARLPQGQRGARVHPLVPAAAAGRGLRGRAARPHPWPAAGMPPTCSWARPTPWPCSATPAGSSRGRGPTCVTPDDRRGRPSGGPRPGRPGRPRDPTPGAVPDRRRRPVRRARPATVSAWPSPTSPPRSSRPRLGVAVRTRRGTPRRAARDAAARRRHGPARWRRARLRQRRRRDVRARPGRGCCRTGDGPGPGARGGPGAAAAARLRRPGPPARARRRPAPRGQERTVGAFSLASYRAYYERWSLTWESQALLRATPIAGDDDLARRFVELVDPLRWPSAADGDAGP